jgi:hypothetical protein
MFGGKTKYLANQKEESYPDESGHALQYRFEENAIKQKSLSDTNLKGFFK